MYMTSHILVAVYVSLSSCLLGGLCSNLAITDMSYWYCTVRRWKRIAPVHQKIVHVTLELVNQYVTTNQSVT